MATRRTIDSLIDELAELRGISRDSALRQALSEALERNEQEYSPRNDLVDESQIKFNYFAQLEMASIEGAVSVIRGIKDHFLAPYVLFVLILAGALIFRQLVGFTSLAIAAMVSLPFYGRFLTRKERILIGVQKNLRNRINGAPLGLPKDMNFLLEPPPDFKTWHIVGIGKTNPE